MSKLSTHVTVLIQPLPSRICAEMVGAEVSHSPRVIFTEQTYEVGLVAIQRGDYRRERGRLRNRSVPMGRWVLFIIRLTQSTPIA